MSTTAKHTAAEEMHSLIAERIEGYTVIRRDSAIRAYGFGEYGCGLNGELPIPNYSADLNLCARAEASVIASVPLLYRDCLLLQMPLDWPHAESIWYIAAPASARVAALYAVAMALDAK